MVSENQLIERVRRRLPSKGDGLREGIGDDAAVLRPKGGAEWVVTTDAFLENVHFLRKIHPAKAVGYKALARATSDIAAMGARARYFFLTLGLPDACAGTWLDDFLDGYGARGPPVRLDPGGRRYDEIPGSRGQPHRCG